ncbi:MAG TPA: MFS transporter [Candidatus Acidoferrales bacterium]|nr:MFS transporter [Candidatus Acidoferrales bacterium]
MSNSILPQVNANAADTRRLRFQQTLTVVLLFTGYAAYYFCRSDLSVAMPLIIDHLHRHSMSANDATIHLGTIASLGVLAYAVGKLFLAGLGDIWGGRRSFNVGLGGAVAFTLLFVSGGALPLFTIAWIGNRLTQSIGWAGLVKVCSKWFNYSSYGTIMGLLSLSFLIGDAAARSWMGSLIQHGYGWRALFYFAAAVAGFILILNLIFLCESRVDAGFSEPEVNPLNLFAESDSKRRNFWSLIRPLLLSRGFIFVCLLSLGCTIVRETFNTWTPDYLHSFFGYSVGASASMSAIFPAVGAVSVLVTGWASDRLGVTGRAVIMFVCLSATTVALLILSATPHWESTTAIPLVLIGAIAFCLLGPYSYLAGAFALDFGGKQAGAVSSGVIDGVGYLGGVFAGDSIARLSVRFGWRGVFVALAAVTALSALAAGYLFVFQRKQQLHAH